MKKSRRATPPVETKATLTNGSVIDAILVTLSVVTVFCVALRFDLDVNRVFDVPKATALKVGGCGLFACWLLRGFFHGVPWKSMRVFGAPVAAITLSAMISTLLSIDPWVSLTGVYERQFGLGGLLGCIGLFVVVVTSVRSRRGALAVMSSLVVVGGIIGSYALLQRLGVDPYGFFPSPTTMAWSTLGNSNLAGDALALLFPLSFLLAALGVGHAVSRTHLGATSIRRSAAVAWVAVGFFVVVALQTIPGWRAALNASLDVDAKQTRHQLSVLLSIATLCAAAVAGSFGPTRFRARSETMQKRLDALLAGGLLASAVAIGIGIFATRARSAWVATAGASFVGLLLAPLLFSETRAQLRRACVACFSANAVIAVAVVSVVVLAPKSFFSTTVTSVFSAFTSPAEGHARGQGTRRYLWAESPRVLLGHRATLELRHRDHDERAANVTRDAIPGVVLNVDKPLTASEKEIDLAWRSVAVFPFGVGLDNYRVAFMSHKSAELEALDPSQMDNPHNNYLYVLACLGVAGLVAYLWLLARMLLCSCRAFLQKEPRSLTTKCAPRAQRAVALAFFLSLVSYCIYSIAGFDSLVSSTFFYVMAGAAAVYFEPQVDEPRFPPWVSMQGQWAAFRGRYLALDLVPRRRWFPFAMVALLSALLAHSVYGALKLSAAEHAIVGKTRAAVDFNVRLENVKKAIALLPHEPVYKIKLAALYTILANEKRLLAAIAQENGETARVQTLLREADDASKLAEIALFASLDHAWAPDDTYLSLMNLYEAWGKPDRAEYATERALQYTPHRADVRAHLAGLKLARGDHAAALVDGQRAIELDANSVSALLTCGRASEALGRKDDATRFYDRARALDPDAR